MMRRLIAWILVCSLMAPLTADDRPEGAPDISSRLKKAVKKAAEDDQTYDLHYQFSAGETVRWKVEHLVAHETKMQGLHQPAKSRSVSVKVWNISKVDDSGNISIVHSIESVDMWQSVSGRKEVRYNSEKDEDPPPEYAKVADTIGVPLATVTLDRFGRITDRQNSSEQFNPRAGEFAIPLPDQPVKIGAKWHLPEEVRLKVEDNRIQRIQLRQTFTLEKVEAGVATIDLVTEVVTPTQDPKLRVQLLDRMTKGTIKFDVDAGRVISKQIDLDETVLGFNGADSMVQYVARFKEELLPPGAAVAKAAGPDVK